MREGCGHNGDIGQNVAGWFVECGGGSGRPEWKWGRGPKWGVGDGARMGVGISHIPSLLSGTSFSLSGTPSSLSGTPSPLPGTQSPIWGPTYFY